MKNYSFKVLILYFLNSCYPCVATNEHYERYFEARGRQLYQLSSKNDDFSKNAQLRWVDDLTVVYGNKKESNYKEMLNVPSDHRKFRKTGILLKMMNGYMKNFDDAEHTLTPERTNFLIPHVSFIVKWNPNEKLEYIPGRFIPFSSNQQHAVFVSGGGQYTSLSVLSDTYNHIMREGDQTPIKLIAKDIIFDWHCIEQIKRIPTSSNHPLKDATFLKDLLEAIQKVQCIKDSEGEIKNSLKIITCSMNLLRFIWAKDTPSCLKDRKDTINRIYELMKKDISEKDLPNIFDADMKNEESKLKFLEELSKRVNAAVFAIPPEHKVKNYACLLNIFSQKSGPKPSEEDATKFYSLLQELLKGKATDKLRPTFNKIIGSYSNDHTERHLIASKVHPCV